MLRVVFDTVIFVRALINPRGPWGRLIFEHFHRYKLVLSRPVLIEALDVLNRPEIRRKYRTTDGLDLARLFQLLERGELVDLEAIPAVSRDPNDDKFLATARAASADYLVSEDQDLLTLGEYEGTKIITAATFLQRLHEED